MAVRREMPLLTINRPIIIRKYIGTANAYTYVNYKVGYKYITDFTTLDVGYKYIYYGKAFVQADGYIEMDITDVIKNYAFRHEYKYNIASQKWYPENFTESYIVQPIENSSHYRTTVFAVTDDNGTWENNVSVTSMFFPEYYEDDTVLNPYYDFDGIVPNINYSGILPQIPMVFTDNYYVGLESIVGETQSLYTTITLDSSTVGAAQISYHGYGNYTASYTLRRFWGMFTTPPQAGIIDGGPALATTPDEIVAGGAASTYPYIHGFGADIIINPDNGTVQYNGTDVLAIDACPAKYYVSWTTPFGEWQSQPLQSVAFEENSDNLNIHTTKRVLHNIENKSQAGFTCKSNLITTAGYKLFSTMIFAPYVLLYDVQKDKSYYCTFDTGSMVTRDKATNQKIIQFTLKQINKTIN